MVTQERLKELYTYEPDNGVFIFNKTRGPMKQGSVAGSLNKHGYLQMHIDGKIYLVHRMVWLYMTGEVPEMWIDHIDTVKTNNVWTNLRLVTPSVSNRNRNKSKRNSSGTVGVSWDKSIGKWYAYICVDSQMIGLGRFDYKEDAILARMTAEKKYNYWVDKAVDNL